MKEMRRKGADRTRRGETGKVLIRKYLVDQEEKSLIDIDRELGTGLKVHGVVLDTKLTDQLWRNLSFFHHITLGAHQDSQCSCRNVLLPDS